jgi:GMP synthase-like glutamine amidotransferase
MCRFTAAAYRSISSAMKLTVIQTGDVPESLRSEFGPYPPMFARMFERIGAHYDYDVVRVLDGAPFPDPATLDAILLPGSAAGVYDDHFTWMAPLRQFIRAAYAARTPMVGVCFGHQIMADALGGAVRKSDKGWGLGRHTYAVRNRPAFMTAAAETLSVACSHQDQVIVPPPDAEVILASDFTPNAGLFYRNGAALSVQPHPEFDDGYTRALAELRRGKAPDAVVETALDSLGRNSDSASLARHIAAFLSKG